MIPGSESYPVLEEAAFKAGSQYDAVCAMWGVKGTCTVYVGIEMDSILASAALTHYVILL